jgi:hypothetical protein
MCCYVGNKKFDSLDDAINQAIIGLKNMTNNKNSTIQLTYWPWISEAFIKIIKYL